MFGMNHFIKTIIVLNSLAFSSLSLSQGTLRHSELRSYNGPECGPATYPTTPREECGKIYETKESSACGPALSFNSGEDLSCPGSDLGGRTVNVGARISNPTLSFEWFNVRGGPIVQGNENLQNVLGSSLSDYRSFGQQINGMTWVKETRYWKCTMTVTGPSSMSLYPNINCVAKPYAATCPLEKFGGKQFPTCSLSTFAVIGFQSCLDYSKPSYPDCQLRKTQTEVDTYISYLESEIDAKSELYAINLSNFLVQSRQKGAMACLIKSYIDNPLYEAVLSDLQDLYLEYFGELFDPTVEYDCQSSSAITDLVYEDVACSTLTTAFITEEVRKATTDRRKKAFYNQCLSQKAFNLTENWFQFQIKEIDFLIGDLVARNNPSVREKLEALKAEFQTTVSKK
jgi:hypothetical protein